MAKKTSIAERRKDAKKLTDKENAFAESYAIHMNASKAAREAGYPAKTAGETGWEVLRRPHVQARIKQLRDEDGKNFGLAREKLVEKLMQIADFDMADMYDEDGRLLKPGHWPAEVRQALNAIESKEDILGMVTTNKVKANDKLRAIDLLAKMQGYYAPEKAPVNPDGSAASQNVIININPIQPKPLDE